MRGLQKYSSSDLGFAGIAERLRVFDIVYNFVLSNKTKFEARISILHKHMVQQAQFASPAVRWQPPASSTLCAHLIFAEAHKKQEWRVNSHTAGAHCIRSKLMRLSPRRLPAFEWNKYLSSAARKSSRGAQNFPFYMQIGRARDAAPLPQIIV